MTTQENIWFDALVKDREDNARVLAKDSMVGYRQSPIDKYSDQAHFVYEFLQNADDTKASRCVFTLDGEGLLFVHNGKTPFSISDPSKESEDRKLGRLGSVNAITAAGLSTKSGNDIGRFGIGFKAVFQYTDEPKVYDDNFKFGLRNEIVPYLLGTDFENRKTGETCFYIPFRNAERVRAHKEISEKIVSITYPLLFLSNLKEIVFESSGMVGRYSKEVCDTKIYDDIDLEFVILKKEIGRERIETKVLKFASEIEGGRISVVFGVDGNDCNVHLVPLKAPAFCFFPTKKDTELNFLIHAPFLLNDSREGIKVGQPHNEKLIAGLSVLAIQAINLMVTALPFETHNWFGRRQSGIRLVKDDILKFVPLELKNNSGEVSFLPFAKVFKAAFATLALIPCQEGRARALCYQKKDKVCWSSDRELIQLLTSDQITCLLGRQQYWGFATVENLSSEQRKFIQECCGPALEWSLIRQKFTAAFFECQPIDWFGRFFDYIVHKPWPWNVDVCKTLPMFLDNDNKAVAAFDEEGNHILYLPAETASTSRTINPRLLQFASVKKIVEQWKIVKESRLAVIRRIIRENLSTDDEDVYAKGFVEVVNYCNSCSDDELEKVGVEFREHPALMAYNPVDKQKKRAKSTDCYYPTSELLFYFDGCSTVSFADVVRLKGLVGDECGTGIEKLLSVLSIRKEPKYFLEVKQASIDKWYGESRKWHYSYRQGCEKWEDLYISKSKEFFKRFVSEEDNELKKKMSLVFWGFLCQIIGRIVPGRSHLEDRMKGVHHYFYDHDWRTEEYETILYGLLKNTVWLFDNNGEFKAHADLFVETLSKEYDVDSRQAEQLLEFLGIKHNE
ncbi:MAG: hypothetical protein IKJ45_17495, partial [Kiritimatiellae bacterium]|nr:hypothetical protein [Kiritimatiellia bacterium]